jgi:tRNA (adenine22-N1)-methyltransferase
MTNFLPPLSHRLQLIFEQLLPGEPVWDLCCDHGKLGRQAVASGLFPRVCFVDSAAHLVERVRARLSAEGADASASFFGLAAEELPEPLSGTVVAAGVGAHTLMDILRGQTKSSPRRFVLGPQRDEEKLKIWLSEDPDFSRRYGLKCQFSVKERGRDRQILIYDLLATNET